MITVEKVLAPFITRLNHIKSETALTIIQITHCSIQRFTVRYIPTIDKKVVIPSGTGALSFIKKSNAIAAKLPNSEITDKIILSLAESFVFIISDLSFFSFLPQLKNPVISIGI